MGAKSCSYILEVLEAPDNVHRATAPCWEMGIAALVPELPAVCKR